MRYLIITYDLSLPIDEGVKNVAYNISRFLSRSGEVLTISIHGEKVPQNTKLIKSNRLFISKDIKREIEKFRPDRIIYVVEPFTIFSFLKAFIIKSYWKNSRISMFVLMNSISNKYKSLLIKIISKFAFLDSILTPSPELWYKLKYFNNVKLCPLGVDINKFQPVTKEKKSELRKKFGIDDDLFVILHVGHLTKTRTLDVLFKIHNISNAQVLFI